MEHFNVIVLGAGSAGCVLASRLSEDESRSVLLLEAGEAYAPDQYPPALTDINGFTVAPQFIWGYQSVVGQPPHRIPAFAGKMVGGSSAINGAISRRARPSDFARWQKHGLNDWSWDNALVTYKSLENTPSGADA